MRAYCLPLWKLSSMQPDRLAFTGARLVLDTEIVETTLTVQDGRIEEIGGEVGASVEVACDGDYLVPGLVEVHTDHLEKQLMPRPRVEWPAVSAVLAHDAQIAAAGITTVLDAVALGASGDNPERMSFLERGLAALEEAGAKSMLRAEHGLHLRCEVSHEDMVEHFLAHHTRPGVRLISLMDHTPGARQYTDVSEVNTYLQKSMGLTSEEAAAEIEARQARSQTYADAHRREISKIARRCGIALASHDDETEAHVAEAIEFGVTIAEFPTTLVAARAARAAGQTIVAGAPNVVRGGSHSGNVSASALFEEGLLDALSSDYMPASLMLAPFMLARLSGEPLWKTMHLVTTGPAAMAGFADRGRIDSGLRADLVRVSEIGGTPVVRAAWRAGMRVV